jgi:hypothetical protein
MFRRRERLFHVKERGIWFFGLALYGGKLLGMVRGVDASRLVDKALRRAMARAT